MLGVPAFVSMPGLVATAIGFVLVGIGALVFAVALVLALASLAAPGVRPLAVGGLVAGALLAILGVLLALYGDASGYGDLADPLSLVLGPLAAIVSAVAGWLAWRWRRRAAAKQTGAA